MKRIRSTLPAVLSLALALVPTAVAWADGKTEMKSHDSKVEVISIDTNKNMITMKDEKGENHTAPLLGEAVEQAKVLKAGDKVMVTWTYDDQGAPAGIKAVKKA